MHFINIRKKIGKDNNYFVFDSENKSVVSITEKEIPDIYLELLNDIRTDAKKQAGSNLIIDGKLCYVFYKNHNVYVVFQQDCFRIVGHYLLSDYSGYWTDELYLFTEKKRSYNKKFDLVKLVDDFLTFLDSHSVNGKLLAPASDEEIKNNRYRVTCFYAGPRNKHINLQCNINNEYTRHNYDLKYFDEQQNVGIIAKVNKISQMPYFRSFRKEK